MGVKYAPNMHIIFFLLKNYIYKEKHKQKKVSFNLRNF